MFPQLDDTKTVFDELCEAQREITGALVKRDSEWNDEVAKIAPEFADVGEYEVLEPKEVINFVAQKYRAQKHALLICAEFFGRELFFDAEISPRLKHKFEELKRMAYDTLGNPSMSEVDQIKEMAL